MRESLSDLFKISAYTPILPACRTFSLQSASAEDYDIYMPMARVGIRTIIIFTFLLGLGQADDVPGLQKP